MFGLAGRFGRVESNAEHCQGGHSRATAMMEPCRDRTCRCSGDGFYQLRPSESPLATQRRTGSVVIRAGIGMAVTTLPVRRRPHSWPGEMTREGVARGSPVRHFVIRDACRSGTPAKCRTRHPAARRYPAFCGGCRPRCPRAGGLLASGKRCSRRRRRGVPGMTLCGRSCLAGWFLGAQCQTPPSR